MKKILKKMAAMVMAAVIGAAMSIPAMAEGTDSTTATTLTPSAYGAIGGWYSNSSSNDWGRTLYDQTNGIRIGGTAAGIVTAYNGTTGCDGKVSFVTFDVPADFYEAGYGYTLSLTDAALVYDKTTPRNGKMNVYTAKADTSTAQISGNTVPTDLSKVTWSTRPKLTDNTLSAADVVTAGDDIKLDVTRLIGKDSTAEALTIAILGDMNSGKAESYYKTVTLTKENLSPLNTDTAIWAQDIVDRGTAVRGTEANNNTETIGAIIDTVTEDRLNIFKLFLGDDAKAGTAIGSKVRLNALDNVTGNSAAKYNGYIEDTVAASTAGTYNIYLMGTGQNTRNYEVTVNGTAYTPTAYTDLTKTTVAHLYSVQVSLNAGNNKIHIQAASGKSAPNFIAMYITKAAPTATTMTRAAFSGTFNGTELADNTMELTVDDETISAWKGELGDTEYTNKTIKVTAKKGDTEKTQEYSGSDITVNDGVFYVIINAVPDSMTFVVE